MCVDDRAKTLGPIRVKGENPQLTTPYPDVYRLYRLFPITKKSASYKRHRGKTVHPVQKLIRFDNWALEVA